MRRFGRVKGLYGPGEIRTHDRNGKTNLQNFMDTDAKTTSQPVVIQIMRCKCIYKTLFKKKINFRFWTKKFRNFEITLPRSGCSRYLKACRRPTLWLLSSHFGRMQGHPLRGKDMKHQSSIYLIKINKTDHSV